MKKQLLSFILVLVAVQLCSGAFTWMPRPAMPSYNRDRATGFVIGDKLYVGTGNNNGTAQTDFWYFDTQVGTWTQVAGLTGARQGATGFAHNGKGYVALGVFGSGSIFYNDLQEYDPVSNSWTFKTPMPSTGRYGTSVFVLNGKAYLVCGNFQTASGPFTDQVWEYDIAADSWLAKANFPGGAKYYTTSFAIGGLGYTGSGGIRTSGGVYIFYDTFYRYDPANNTWTPIAPFPGGLLSGMTSVVVNNKAIVGGGNDVAGVNSGDFHVYDPATGTWSAGPSLPPGEERSQTVGLTGPASGFVATGIQGLMGMNDLWEITETLGVVEGNGAAAVQILYNGSSISVTGNTNRTGTLKLYSMKGQLLKKWETPTALHTDILPAGVYLVNYSEQGRVVEARKICIGSGL